MNLRIQGRSADQAINFKNHLAEILRNPKVPRLAVETLAKWYVSPLLAGLIISFGIMVRLIAFIHNPSLWVDEAALATSILNNSSSGLLGYLQSHTAAPLGFLLVEKWVVGLLGNTEQSFRLFPLLAGVASLLLMYPVAKRYVSPWAVPIALGLFATSTSLVRYSNQVKQYSGDVLFALIILLLTSVVIEKRYQSKWLVIYALVGSVGIWFSFPFVFILAGVSAVITWQALRERHWRTMIHLCFVGAAWLASFSVFYVAFSFNELLQERGVIDYLSEKSIMVPLIPRSMADVRWFLETPLELLNVPAGIALTGIAMLSFVLGWVALWKTNSQRLFLLVTPLLVTILVSGMQLYPFTNRWVLFLVPGVLLLVAEGTAFIFTSTKRAGAAIWVTLMVLLLLFPVTSELYRLIEPRGTEEVRPVLQYIQSNRLEGDNLYVYPGASKAFIYYANRLQLEESEYIISARDTFQRLGHTDLNVYIEEINQLRGNRRVWFLFSNVDSLQFGDKPGTQINEEAFHVFYLDNIGERLDQFRVHNAAAYLYDLTPKDNSNISYIEPTPPRDLP